MKGVDLTKVNALLERQDARERETLAEMAALAEKLRASGGHCDCGRYGLFTVTLSDGRVFTGAGIHGRGGIFRLGDGCPTEAPRLLADVKRLFKSCLHAEKHRAMTIYLAERYCGSETLVVEPEEIRMISIASSTGVHAFMRDEFVCPA